MSRVFKFIPSEILEILDIIEYNGYESYIVGGCIRDILLGRTPSDYDIATNAKPKDIQKIFSDFKTLDIGKEFGTILLFYKKEKVEITTYRIEGDYKDGRRPEKVMFSSNIIEDLSRRDFTINAMAYNKRRGLQDPFGGKKDLTNKVIRTVGSADKRFEEDHLRIIRAVRFSTQLNFSIEDETFRSSKKNANLIKKLSAERIRDEFFKIIMSKVPSKGIRLLEELNILKLILPELTDCIGFEQKNPYHNKDVYEHSLCVLDNIKPNLEIRLAGLFHDIGKPETFILDEDGIGHFYGHEKISAIKCEKILKRLNCSKKMINKVCLLVREHMGHNGRLSDKGIRRLLNRVKEENVFDLLELQRADMYCSHGNQDFKMLNQRENDIKRILNNKDAYEKNKLKINGYDIIKLGFTEGEKIGEILDYLMDKVIENPQLNTKETLLKLIDINYMKKGG